MRELDNRLMRHIDLLVERYPSLESAKNDIVAAYLLLEESYENGGKLLVAGNGGSAADAEHIVGELMKGFKPVSYTHLVLHMKLTFRHVLVLALLALLQLEC